MTSLYLFVLASKKQKTFILSILFTSANSSWLHTNNGDALFSLSDRRHLEIMMIKIKITCSCLFCCQMYQTCQSKTLWSNLHLHFLSDSNKTTISKQCPRRGAQPPSSDAMCIHLYLYEHIRSEDTKPPMCCLNKQDKSLLAMLNIQSLQKCSV